MRQNLYKTSYFNNYHQSLNEESIEYPKFISKYFEDLETF